LQVVSFVVYRKLGVCNVLIAEGLMAKDFILLGLAWWMDADSRFPPGMTARKAKATATAKATARTTTVVCGRRGAKEVCWLLCCYI
jgi:hypothetical protein